MRGVGVEVARAAAEAERLTVDERDETGRVAETGRFTGEHPWAGLHWTRVHCSILVDSCTSRYCGRHLWRLDGLDDLLVVQWFGQSVGHRLTSHCEGDGVGHFADLCERGAVWRAP